MRNLVHLIHYLFKFVRLNIHRCKQTKLYATFQRIPTVFNGLQCIIKRSNKVGSRHIDQHVPTSSFRDIHYILVTGGRSEKACDILFIGNPIVVAKFAHLSLGIVKFFADKTEEHERKYDITLVIERCTATEIVATVEQYGFKIKRVLLFLCFFLCHNQSLLPPLISWRVSTFVCQLQHFDL